MGFLMKDRCLFPERPLSINRDDFKIRIGKGVGKDLSGVGLDAVRTRRNPGREWTNLQSDCRPDIFSRKCRRIEHIDCMRIVFVNSSDHARDWREEMV